MNKSYKVIFNRFRGASAVVSEITSSRQARKKAIVTVSVALAMGMIAGQAISATNDYGVVIGTGSNAGNLNQSGFTYGTYTTTATGSYSTAMGVGTTASGDYSTAMGRETTASGDWSTAMGVRTTASGSYSTAMGLETIASKYASTAMGYRTNASEQYATAMGYSTTASGLYSTAMGRDTTASGQYATAMGYLSKASGKASTALGDWTTASGDWSTAIGNQTIASGVRSTAMGSYSQAVGVGSLAGGYGSNGNSKTERGGIALGTGSYAFGTGAVAGNTTATADSNGNYYYDLYHDVVTYKDGIAQANTSGGGSNQIAMGYMTWAKGDNSVAIGTQTQSLGNYSITMGFQTKAVGDNSTAMGNGTIASGQYATAMGAGTTASGNGSTAMGDSTTASGGYSTATGRNTVASGNYSTAIGMSSQAIGDGSFAGGSGTFSVSSGIAYGQGSFAFGTGAVAGKILSGAGTQESPFVYGGDNSIAMGFNSTASGNDAVAIGKSNSVTNAESGAFGQSNTVNFTEDTTKHSYAIGYGNSVTGANSIAVGVSNTVSGAGSGAFGDPNKVYANSAYAFGNDNTIGVSGTATTAAGSFAIGNNNTITTNNTFVLGSNVTSSGDSVANNVILGGATSAKTISNVTNSVVLGMNSDGAAASSDDTKYKIGTTEITPQGTASTANGSVSVGASGTERQIKNVAPGAVTSTSTDAINGSQLYGVVSALNITDEHNYYTGTSTATSVKEAVNALDAGIGAKITDNGNVIKKSATNSVNANISALDTAIGTWSTTTDKGGHLTAYKDASAATTSVGANLTALDQVLTNITYTDGTTTIGNKLTVSGVLTASAGIDANNKSITNVASAGTLSETNSNAVNGADLYAVSSALTADTTMGTTPGNYYAANGRVVAAIEGIDTAIGTWSTTTDKGGHLTAYKDASAATTSVGANLTALDQVLTNITYTDGTTTIGNKLTVSGVLTASAGIDANNKSITNVASAGTLSATNYNAVNGADLYKATTMTAPGENYDANVTIVSAVGKIDKQVYTLKGYFNEKGQAIEAIKDSLGNVISETYAKMADIVSTYVEKATTLAGYGITDVYTKKEVDLLVSAGSSPVLTFATPVTAPVTNTLADVGGGALDASMKSLTLEESGVIADAKIEANAKKAVTGDAVYQYIQNESLGIAGATVTADSQSIGIGSGSNVSGKQSIAIGVGHKVSGNYSGAFGDPTIITGNNSYSVGNDNEISADNVFVLGSNAKVSSKNTVVLGGFSVKTKVNAENGVVLGYDSTPVANAVSVGSSTNQRQIKYVAAPTDATDAANKQYVDNTFANATSSVANLDSRLTKKINRLGAKSAAISALHPMGLDEDHKVSASAGVGTYGGQAAAAVGVFYKPNENWMFNIGGAAGRGSVMGNIGVNYRFGAASSVKTLTPSQVAARVVAMQDTNRSIEAQLKASLSREEASEKRHQTEMAQQRMINTVAAEEIAQLKRQNAKLIRDFAKMKSMMRRLAANKNK